MSVIGAPVLHSTYMNVIELSAEPQVEVAQKRKSSLLESLGIWRPYPTHSGGDVGIFPA